MSADFRAALAGYLPEVWGSVGFRLDGDVCRVGGIAIRLAGTTEGKGLLGWSLHGAESAELDGLVTSLAVGTSRRAMWRAPPNGVVSLDHVVAFSPDLDRTVDACRAAGLDFRRVREGPTPAGAQRRPSSGGGETLLEVVEHPEPPDREAPAALWGLAFIVADLGETAAMLGELVGEPRPAVQEGRQIATLRRTAGLTVPVALMTA